MERQIGTPESGKPVSRFEFNLISGLVIGISVVCGLGFVTLLVSYFEQNAVSYENLKDKVMTQNFEIEMLTRELQNHGMIATTTPKK